VVRTITIHSTTPHQLQACLDPKKVGTGGEKRRGGGGYVLSRSVPMDGWMDGSRTGFVVLGTRHQRHGTSGWASYMKRHKVNPKSAIRGGCSDPSCHVTTHVRVRAVYDGPDAAYRETEQTRKQIGMFGQITDNVRTPTSEGPP
jgi:hypothetical protein